MTPQHGRRVLAPILALFIVGFAAQQASSASISSLNNYEDTYSQETTLTELLSLSTDLYSDRAPAVFTCILHYASEINDITIRGATVVINTSKLVTNFYQNYTKCPDIKCKVDLAAATIGKSMDLYNQIRVLAIDTRYVWTTVIKCTREGGPTPAPPPTTQPTTPPTTSTTEAEVGFPLIAIN